MRIAHITTGSNMFIRVSMMLVTCADSEDEAVVEATYEEHGWTDTLLNINEITRVYTDMDGVNWIELRDGRYLKIKQTVPQLHEKINNSLHLPLLS